jgi:outer membrane protein assembly factor BamB
MSLRIWPGVLVALVILILRWIVPIALPHLTIVGILAGVGGFVLILLWWLLFSRAPWQERIAAPLLMAAAIGVTWWFAHESIATGMMDRMLFVYAVPTTLPLFFVAWAVMTRRRTGLRMGSMALAIFAGSLCWLLVRTEGITGEGMAQLAWRWTATPEERLLAQSSSEAPAGAPPAGAPAAVASAAAAAPVTPAAVSASAASGAAAKPEAAAPDPVRVEWPGFRGPQRDGVIHGSRIAADWDASPPSELWRRPIGPGWSSFAVAADRIFTQEQRGEAEVVAAYDRATGQPVWAHEDPVRFWESNGGAGPRSTPTLADGRVYTLGATGVLNVLDAATGRVIWTRNAAEDVKAAVPHWGFTSSPLLYQDLVIIQVGGLVAYDRATGGQRWVGKTRRGSYSSPHLVTVGGTEQIVQLNGFGAISVSPRDGTELWQFAWEGAPIIQPASIAGGDLLIASGDMMGGMGLKRLGIARTGDVWVAQEKWTSRGLKPYFNDVVLHKGHAYGFDGSILSCVELETGERRWKGGRYGQGQMLLLADQDLLLVLAEEGDLALVRASPDGFVELSRVKAIDGKTWNHPVLTGNTLLVRNGEEMAAFKLPAVR